MLHEVREYSKCNHSPAYFCENYLQIYDATDRVWVPFHLWPAQYEALKCFECERLNVVLKARQLGLTWLALGFGLWLTLFRPSATTLLFSRRDDEAVYLLGEERFLGMYNRLPDYLRSREITINNAHEFAVSNGSIVRAFPTSAGDSYTASLVIIDEADLVPDFGRLMRSVKPTIDGGGRMIVVSRSDKADPMSEFKNLYRAAKAGVNGWRATFMPWYARPTRSEGWYEEQRREIFERTGSYDDLHEQYPATDLEALAPAQRSKRLPLEWLQQCAKPLRAKSGLTIAPQLEIYENPIRWHKYVIGCDPAEGNPGSDDSALEVIDIETGHEVAALAYPCEVSNFAALIDAIGQHYNHAAVLVLRNNHGHAVLGWLNEHSGLRLIHGTDGKPGFVENRVTKPALYVALADALRDMEIVLHSEQTIAQCASIEGSTLSAPEGLHDDRASALCAANWARRAAGAAFETTVIVRSDVLEAIDNTRGY